MTVKEILKRVAEIKQAKGDDEKAHGLEDQLYHDVLVAIARGSKKADELALAALETRYIEFSRWCA